MLVKRLIFEITRRCNLTCEHCLRGDPQEIDIENRTINNVLDWVKEIDLLIFSGGEPTLAVDKIAYIVSEIKRRKISCKEFITITNGKIASKELVRVLSELYNICSGKNFIGLVISRDFYHKKILKNIKEAHFLYNSLPYFSYSSDLTEYVESQLIKEGRARDGGPPEFKRLNWSAWGEHVFSIDWLCINALGDVLLSDDLSYESQEKYRVGNINDRPLPKVIRNGMGGPYVQY